MERDDAEDAGLATDAVVPTKGDVGTNAEALRCTKYEFFRSRENGVMLGDDVDGI